MLVAVLIIKSKNNGKTLVYCLELNGKTAIYFNIDDLAESIKWELETIDLDDKYQVYTKEITEQELNNMPEFDGF